MRYLYEERPDIRVIAAGSLLEFAVGKVRSWPVGRVQFYTVHPLTFAEFLTWTGRQRARELLEAGPVESYAFKPLLEAFHRYTILGGMPEVVKQYAERGSVAEVADVYEAIWGTYLRDTEKYATTDQQRDVLRLLMQTAASQDDRISFANFAGSDYRSEAVREAFLSLQLAGVLRLIYPTSSVQAPPVPHRKRRPRIQLLDTGLLNYSRGIQSTLLSTDDLNSLYRGRIAQHIVTQEIIAQHHQSNYEPYFYVREKAGSSTEVDLVIQRGPALIPIEVKAGPQGRLRSLHQYVERSPLKLGLRLLSNEFSVEEVRTPAGHPYRLVNIPYFAAGHLEAYITDERVSAGIDLDAMPA